MRLTMVLYSLGGGGAERVALNLAGGFVADGHAVTIITLARTPDAYAIPDGVERVALDLAGAGSILNKIMRNLRQFAVLRRAIMRTRPSAVISFMDVTNVTALIALMGTGVPVIVTEHSDPATFPIRNRFWGLLRRWTYPRAAHLVSVSGGIDAFFGWLPTTQRAVIANPLPLIDFPQASGDSQQIVAMGRFVPKKGFDLLIDAFALIAPDYPDWRLLIMGDGDLRDDLTAQIARHGLTDRVDLPGFVAQPFERLAESAFFVLSSRTEGFGNVMIEAMACGLPVVSFDCPASPREIITPDHDGLLVPPEDVAALAGASRRMIDHPDERRRLSVNARETSARYHLSAITARWYDLFDSVGVKHDMM